MARFKYLGEPSRPGFVVTYGPSTQIRVPQQDGTKNVINAPGPGGFVIGADIGVEITDPMSLRYLRADTRFQEIV